MGTWTMKLLPTVPDLMHGVFFLGLLFSPEDAGKLYLRNAHLLSPNYRTLYVER
jgi:hypothetical protein